MEKKGMDPQEKREYELLQKRKKRRLKRRRRAKRDPNIFGNIILVLQALISVFFMGMLLILNVIPTEYFLIIIACLAVCWLIGMLSQMGGRKYGKAGKIYMTVMILLLVSGSCAAGKMKGAMGHVTGGDEKIDRMVVAVLADDPANNLKDAADYTFGVQYTVKGDQVESTMKRIREELGKDVAVKEYQSVNEQAKALRSQEVKAIVYNESYKEILEDELKGYSDKVKIIYSYDIKTELKDLTINVAVKDEPFAVYLSGIDVYGEISKTSRSDVNIIAVVNPNTHQILLVTTPRDYYVEIPGVSKGQKDKLTHAGMYGVDASINTLSQLYELEIPFFARVNFTSLIEIVDKLGGVDVNSEYAFRTGTESGAVVWVKEGMNHFNGTQALAFSRERHNLKGGDNQRGKNQQAVITAMIKKMVSPAMLMKANSIIDSVSKNVETNMSGEQLQTLIKMQLSEGSSWNIFSVAAEGTGARDTCYSSGSVRLYVTKPNYESVAAIKELIQKVQSGEMLEGSETTK